MAYSGLSFERNLLVWLMDKMMRGAYLADRLRRVVFRSVTLGVRIMLIRDTQVLLVRHTYLPGLYFPGGGTKFGETLEAAARREAREEVGADIQSIRLFGIYSRVEPSLTDHVALFVSEQFEIHPVSSLEIKSTEWHSLESPPPDAVGDVPLRLTEYRTNPQSVRCGDWKTINT